MSAGNITTVALGAVNAFFAWKIYQELQMIYKWWATPRPPPPVSCEGVPLFKVPNSVRKKKRAGIHSPPTYFATNNGYKIYPDYVESNCSTSDPQECDWNLKGWYLVFPESAEPLSDVCLRLQDEARTNAAPSFIKYTLLGEVSHGTGQRYLIKRRDYIDSHK